MEQWSQAVRSGSNMVDGNKGHRLTIKPLCVDEIPENHTDMLSPFQKEKFIYYFSKFFDTNDDGVIDKTDFPRLNQKIFEYTGWGPDSDAARFLEDLHNNFFECLAEKAGQDGKVTLDAWLNMWGKLTRRAMSMSNFPYWLQLLPKVLFEVIDRDHDGVISQEELKHFYQFFVGLDKDRVDSQTNRAYESMTAYKDVYLTEPEQFTKLRNDGALLFMQIPLLEIDGLQIIQSRAIARYLANKYGFYTNDSKKNAIIDMVYEGAKDFYQNYARFGFSPQDRVNITLEFEETLLPRYLSGFTKILEEHGGKYLINDKLTLADIAVFECLYCTEEEFPEVLSQYPELKLYFENLKKTKGIANFIASDRFLPKLTPEFALEAKRILLIKKNPV